MSGYTPLSMTATVTPAPSVTDHAGWTSSMSSTHVWLSLTASAGAAGAGGAATAGMAAAQGTIARAPADDRREHHPAPAPA